MAEWSTRRTRNHAVLGSSPPLATCLICSRSSQVHILGRARKWVSASQLGFLFLSVCSMRIISVQFEWGACKLAG